MTRDELTREIAKRVNDIRNLYYSVYLEGDELYMKFNKDSIDIRNRFYKEDKDYSIDYYENRDCIGINGVWEDK